MATLFDWGNGVFWGLAYLGAVYNGFKQKTHCIPTLSMCLCFSWEFLAVFSRIVEHQWLNGGFIIQSLWLALDIGIVLTWILYNKHSPLKKTIIFCCCFFVVYLVAYKAQFQLYSSFIINLFMSVEFLWRIHKQNGPWTSMYIAALKLLGTLAATICYGVLCHNHFVTWIGGLCLIFDIYYVYLIVVASREDSL